MRGNHADLLEWHDISGRKIEHRGRVFAEERRGGARRGWSFRESQRTLVRESSQRKNCKIE
jgi:DNA/RNA-binding domain of Phe-tRNA-synthetase-like protein